MLIMVHNKILSHKLHKQIIALIEEYQFETDDVFIHENILFEIIQIYYLFFKIFYIYIRFNFIILSIYNNISVI